MVYFEMAMGEECWGILHPSYIYGWMQEYWDAFGKTGRRSVLLPFELAVSVAFLDIKH